MSTQDLHKNKPGVVVHICNSSTAEPAVEGCLGSLARQPSLPSWLQPVTNCLKKTGRQLLGNNWDSPLTSRHMHAHMCNCTHRYVVIQTGALTWSIVSINCIYSHLTSLNACVQKPMWISLLPLYQNTQDNQLNKGKRLMLAYSFKAFRPCFEFMVAWVWARGCWAFNMWDFKGHITSKWWHHRLARWLSR